MVIALGLLLFAGLATAVLAVALGSRLGFLRRAVAAPAKLLHYQRITRTDSDGADWTHHHAVVTFTDRAGNFVMAQAMDGWAGPLQLSGALVTVWYDPANPTQLATSSPRAFLLEWGMLALLFPCLFGLIGGILLVATW